MKTTLYAVLLIAAMSGSTSVHSDGLVHAKQVIFGMDCAPCAYGMEKGLKALPGVQSVTVSLNEGYAEVHLAPNSTTSLTDIREVVRKGGFTPNDAQITLQGRLQLSPSPMLTTAAGQFALELGALGEPSVPLQGLRVQVSGSVAADSAELIVARIDPVASQ
ncbi:heavy-metal-associated domain-containing protein [Pseudomarimonas arenosa]|uniref:Cation transporter n=1 Tax=Pseudomarimonas arenosa TaxID=2774145 RepID=A0AAW3ZDL1_9GAMM|nr:heavy metal-associated domain-containing protein [Pseudomarimonas arenosa]MBD8524385.1 cation transporter [Pseudomarimonas arenosa]